MAAKQPLVERPKGRSSILGMRQAGHDLRNEDGTTQTGASLYELSTTHECGWDYCLVFPIPNAENGETWTSDDYAHKDCKLTWQTAVPKLEKAGLQTFLFRSCQKDEMYVKIKCPMSRLEEQADVMNYKMLLDPVELKATLHSGFDFPEGHCAPIMINPMKEFFPPTEYIHGKYDREDEVLQKLYLKAHGGNHPFSSLHRLKLTRHIIECGEDEGGCGLTLDKLVGEGEDEGLKAHFCLHEAGYANYLAQKYIVWCRYPGSEPIDLFRCYFGAKLALYMAFLSHLTRWMVMLSVPGLVVAGLTIYHDNADIMWSGVYAIFVAIWGVAFLESWKRKQVSLAMKWGMSEFENEETERSDYERFPGVAEVNSPVDGSPIKWYPERMRRCAYIRSFFATAFAMLCVMAFVSSVFYMKTLWGYWPDYATLINSIGIQVLNGLYQKLAIVLTNAENPRTDTQYEDALINKLFVFQFLNSYVSLYYIAFIELPYTQKVCQYGSCINDLCVDLASVFIVNLMVANLTAIVLPKINAATKFKEETDGLPPDIELAPAELQYMMLPFDTSLDQLLQYNALALQYGFVVLFVAAFPAAPFLAMFSNYMQIRFDCSKFLYGYRRIQPIGGQDIGSWEGIISMLNNASVLTNAGLVFFTMSIVEVNERLKVIGFILVTYGLFCVMKVVEMMAPEVPEDVEIQLARQEFINSKVIDKVADETETVGKHFEKAPAPEMADKSELYDSINDFFTTAGAREEATHSELKSLS